MQHLVLPNLCKTNVFHRLSYQFSSFNLPVVPVKGTSFRARSLFTMTAATNGSAAEQRYDTNGLLIDGEIVGGLATNAFRALPVAKTPSSHDALTMTAAESKHHTKILPVDATEIGEITTTNN